MISLCVAKADRSGAEFSGYSMLEIITDSRWYGNKPLRRSLIFDFAHLCVLASWREIPLQLERFMQRRKAAKKNAK